MDIGEVKNRMKFRCMVSDLTDDHVMVVIILMMMMVIILMMMMMRMMMMMMMMRMMMMRGMVMVEVVRTSCHVFITIHQFYNSLINVIIVIFD